MKKKIIVVIKSFAGFNSTDVDARMYHEDMTSIMGPDALGEMYHLGQTSSSVEWSMKDIRNNFKKELAELFTEDLEFEFRTDYNFPRPSTVVDLVDREQETIGVRSCASCPFHHVSYNDFICWHDATDICMLMSYKNEARVAIMHAKDSNSDMQPGVNENCPLKDKDFAVKLIEQ